MKKGTKESDAALLKAHVEGMILPSEKDAAAVPVREFPCWVRKAGEPDLLVNSADELAALIASNGEGWE